MVHQQVKEDKISELSTVGGRRMRRHKSLDECHDRGAAAEWFTACTCESLCVSDNV